MSDEIITNNWLKQEERELEKWIEETPEGTTRPSKPLQPQAAPEPAAKPAPAQPAQTPPTAPFAGEAADPNAVRRIVGATSPGELVSGVVGALPQLQQFLPGQQQQPAPPREETISRPQKGLTLSQPQTVGDLPFLDYIKTWAGDVGAWIWRKMRNDAPAEFGQVSQGPRMIGMTILSPQDQFTLFGKIEEPPTIELDPYRGERISRFLGEMAADPANFTAGFPGGARIIGASSNRLAKRLAEQALTEAKLAADAAAGKVVPPGAFFAQRAGQQVQPPTGVGPGFEVAGQRPSFATPGEVGPTRPQAPGAFFQQRMGERVRPPTQDFPPYDVAQPLQLGEPRSLGAAAAGEQFVPMRRGTGRVRQPVSEATRETVAQVAKNEEMLAQFRRSQYPKAPADMPDVDILAARYYDDAPIEADPALKPQWDALAAETEQTYNEILETGLKVEKVTGQPYADAAEMFADIERGVFKVTTDNSEHPFWNVDQNWRFRVVHDYLGHFIQKNDFSLEGERAAFLKHVTKMKDEGAANALETEIYGQAASAIANREFAPQKAMILPEEARVPRPSKPLRLEHYTTQKGLERIEPEKFGTGQAGRERARAAEPGFQKRSFFYEEGARPEARFARAPYKYTVEVPPEKVYDVAADPLALRAGGLRGTEMETKIREAGFAGYRDLSPETPVPGAVQMFEPTEVMEARSILPGYMKDEAGRIEKAQYRLDRLRDISQVAAEGVEAVGAAKIAKAAIIGTKAFKDRYEDLITVGAVALQRGNPTLKDFSAAMVDEVGEWIKPELPRLWKESGKRLKRYIKAAKTKMPKSEEVTAAAARGEAGHAWYHDVMPELTEHFGNDAVLVRKFIAATSPLQNVEKNVELALEAYANYRSGAGFGGMEFGITGAQTRARLDKLVAWWEQGADEAVEPLTGRKVMAFDRAMAGDDSAFVADRWIWRYFFGKDIGSDMQYDFMREWSLREANQMGLSVRDFQAQLWVAHKSETEALEGARGVRPTGTLDPMRQVIREQVRQGMRQIDDVPGMDEAGRVNLAALGILARGAAGGTMASLAGDDPEEAARYALLGAGLGLVLSPKLARKMAEAITSPAGMAAQKNLLRQMNRLEVLPLDVPEAGGLQAFAGAPQRPRLNPNPDRMNEPDVVKRVAVGISQHLERAKALQRSGVETHETTLRKAAESRFRNAEEVLNLDQAGLKLEELPAAQIAARDVRDATVESLVEKAARARETGDPALLQELRNELAVTGKLVARVADMQSWLGIAQNAQKIPSTAKRVKYDYAALATEWRKIDGALALQASDAEIMEMILRTASDAESGARLAQAAAAKPAALWNIYYGLNLLSSPLTHAKNILGDGVALGISLADRAVAEGIELVTYPFTAAGLRKQHVAFGETYDMVRGVAEMIGDSFRAGKQGARQIAGRTLRTGESAFSDVTKASERLTHLEAMGEGGTLPRILDVMNTAAQYNLRFMDATDEFFKVLSFTGEMRALARRQAMSEGLHGSAASKRVREILDAPDGELLSAANAFAHENTFTKAFDQHAGGWRQLWGTGAAAEKFSKNPFVRFFVAPFFRTPTRLAEYSMVHTPILNALAIQSYSDIAAGGAKAELALSKLAVGAGVGTLAAWYAAHGLLTGEAPNDPELRASMEEAGWQEYSAYVPGVGKYFSYKGIEPLATILGTIANFVQRAPDMQDNQIQTIATAIVLAAAPAALTNPYAQGISDIGDVIEGIEGERIEPTLKYLGRRLASLIPGSAAVRAVARAADPYARETKTVPEGPPEGRELRIMLNEIMPRWNKPAKVNRITGEPVMNEQGWMGLVNPIQISRNKNDRALNELARLEGAGLPKEFPRVIGGLKPSSSIFAKANNPKEGVWLSDSERTELSRIMTREVKDIDGHTLHEALIVLLDDEFYKDAVDEDKALQIRQTWTSFFKDAQDIFLEKHPDVASVINRRQIDRSLNRLPSSMEDLKDPMREALEEVTQ